MRTRTRLITAAASLAVAGSAVIGIGPAAMAQQAKASCPGETLCLYQNDDFGGRVEKFSHVAHDANLGTFNNSASSMINNTGRKAYLWSGKSFSGKKYVAKGDTQDGDFSNNGFDNTAESVHVAR